MTKKKEPAAVIIGYKGFDKNWKCKGLQYKVGRTQTHEGNIKLCSTGLHFCENPLDVLNYYDLVDGNIAVVEAADVSDETKEEDSKRVAKKLTIKAKLDLPAFVKASVEFVWNVCKQEPSKEVSDTVSDSYSSKLAASGDSSQLAASGDSSQLAASGDYSKLAASGYSSKLAASGYSSQLAASGYSSKLAASGYSSQLAASGYYSKLAASGDSSKLAASGDSSQLAASGDSSKLAASGDSSQLAASGDSSKLAASGEDSVVAGIGYDNTAKATKGSWIVLAEWVDQKPVCVKSVQVDGKDIKADTYYRLTGGEFVEVK